MGYKFLPQKCVFVLRERLFPVFTCACVACRYESVVAEDRGPLLKVHTLSIPTTHTNCHHRAPVEVLHHKRYTQECFRSVYRPFRCSELGLGCCMLVYPAQVHFMGWEPRWDLMLDRTSPSLQRHHSRVPNWRVFRTGDRLPITKVSCFILRFRSHSIIFTGAEGIRKCKIGLGRGRDGRVFVFWGCICVQGLVRMYREDGLVRRRGGHHWMPRSHNPRRCCRV
jgi:hypothetical protein